MTSQGRILIIDDSEVVLSQLKQQLTSAGYEVVTTSQTVGTGRFLRGTDIVILDFHMPGMDGSHVLESLRAACRDMDTKPSFYLYTTDRNVAASYRALGFDGAFTEKGDAAALLRQLQAAYRLVKLRRA
jgi:two-component system OmpR family response regulator